MDSLSVIGHGLLQSPYERGIQVSISIEGGVINTRNISTLNLI